MCLKLLGSGQRLFPISLWEPLHGLEAASKQPQDLDTTRSGTKGGPQRPFRVRPRQKPGCVSSGSRARGPHSPLPSWLWAWAPASTARPQKAVHHLYLPIHLALKQLKTMQTQANMPSKWGGRATGFTLFHVSPEDSKPTLVTRPLGARNGGSRRLASARAPSQQAGRATKHEVKSLRLPVYRT